MIKIKIYKNGYEITGHAEDSICRQVSLWHWIVSNLIIGLDGTAKEYTSSRDNKDNTQEGCSWLMFNSDKIPWIYEDLIVSIEEWVKEFCKGQVNIEQLNKDWEKEDAK